MACAITCATCLPSSARGTGPRRCAGPGRWACSPAARIGYGFEVLKGGYVAIPEIGFGLGNTEREVRLGWRLAEQTSAAMAFELGVEATRVETAENATNARHGVTVGAGWRLTTERNESFEVRVEGARDEAENSDRRPEHSIAVRLGAHW